MWMCGCVGVWVCRSVGVLARSLRLALYLMLAPCPRWAMAFVGAGCCLRLCLQLFVRLFPAVFV